MPQPHRWKHNHRKYSRPYQNHQEAHRHNHTQHMSGNHGGNSGNQGNSSHHGNQATVRHHGRQQHCMRWGDLNRTGQQYSRYRNDERQMRNQKNPNYDRRDTPSGSAQNPCQLTSSLSSDPNQSRSSSQSGSLSGSQSEGSSSSCSSNKPKVKDLPGFYYDPEKKKYFRLLPGHNNHNPLTKDGLKLKAAEKDRVHMMQGKGLVKIPLDKLKSKKHDMKPVLLQLVRNQQLGNVQTRQFHRYTNEQCISALPAKPTSKLTPCVDNYFAELGVGAIAFFKVDRQHRKVLMMIEDAFISKLCHGTVQWGNSKSRQLNIHNYTEVCNHVHTPNYKVTNVEWASSDVNEDVKLLYTVAKDKLSTAFLVRSYQENASSTSSEWKSEMVYRADVSNEIIWTCAWNHNSQLEPQFCLGGSKKAVVFRIEPSSRREFFSGNSDVVTQVYSLQQPLLYNGTRSGEILGCDLRTSCKCRADVTCQLKHQICMSSLNLLKDENYIVASDIGSKVKLWDIRMCRCVFTCEGFADKQVSVDSSETVVYGAGPNKTTKFWSLQDGRLLHTIPCPLPLQTSGYPIPVYSQQWHNDNTPGLIIGMERQLFSYNLSL